MSNEHPNAYDVVIADLEAEYERLRVTIAALKRIKGLGVPFQATRAFVTGQPNNPAYQMAKIPHDAFFGMTIPDAARKYLSWEGSKQTKSNPDLCDALVEGGFQTTAANFRESVRATLSRHPDFVKIKGQWGLKEWYGNRGTRKAKRGSSAAALQSDKDAGNVSSEEAEPGDESNGA